MATAGQVQACLNELKTHLRAAGFSITDGAGVDTITWQAVAVLVGSINADRLAGKGVTADVQLAACNAIKATLAKMPAEQRTVAVFEQRKRLQPPGPSGLPSSAGAFAALGLGVLALGIGIFLAFKGGE